MVYQSPAIKALPVHLEGENEVLLDDYLEDEDLDDAIDVQKRTKLEMYFHYNTNTPPWDSHKQPMMPGNANIEPNGCVRCPCTDDAGRGMIRHQLHCHNYEAFGSKMRWHNYQWKVYSNAVRSIARCHMATYSDLERFSLRLLLLHIPYPKSYADMLRKADGTLHTTFAEAATAHRLLKNDDAWIRTFEEMCIRMNNWYRALDEFALILVHNELTDAKAFTCISWNASGPG